MVVILNILPLNLRSAEKPWTASGLDEMYRGKMRSDTHGEGDDYQVFDNILPFKGRGKESLPCHVSEEHERHDGHDHVRDEQGDRQTLTARDEKSDTNDHFIYRETNNEGIKRHEWHGRVEKVLDHRIGRTGTYNFENAKPKKDHKYRHSAKWHAHLP